jgi:hypothetical protein
MGRSVVNYAPYLIELHSVAQRFLQGHCEPPQGGEAICPELALGSTVHTFA